MVRITGADGIDGANGASAVLPGGAGSNGTAGADGESLVLALTLEEFNTSALEGDGGYFLDAGRGGVGGSGGNGMSGGFELTIDEPDHQVRQYHAGGNGGDGATGGDGGNATLSVASLAGALTMGYVPHLAATGGAGRAGGSGGSGGSGGTSSYSDDGNIVIEWIAANAGDSGDGGNGGNGGDASSTIQDNDFTGSATGSVEATGGDGANGGVGAGGTDGLAATVGNGGAGGHGGDAYAGISGNSILSSPAVGFSVSATAGDGGAGAAGGTPNRHLSSLWNNTTNQWEDTETFGAPGAGGAGGNGGSAVAEITGNTIELDSGNADFALRSQAGVAGLGASGAADGTDGSATLRMTNNFVTFNGSDGIVSISLVDATAAPEFSGNVFTSIPGGTFWFAGSGSFLTQVTLDLATDALTVAGGANTLTGFDNFDFSGVRVTINGTTGNDSLYPGGMRQVAGVNITSGQAAIYYAILNGGDGDDTIQGGGGNDQFNGGTGTDTAFYGYANGGVRSDYVIVPNTDGSFTVTDRRARGDGSDRLTDIETIEFYGGATLSIAKPAGGVSIFGTSGNDAISAFTAPAGQPLATANGDVLAGYAGNDNLNGGAGADLMFGGRGDDIYAVDNTGDSVIENLSEGTDTVRSSVTVTLTDNVENLFLVGAGVIDGTGNGLANTLTGSALDNVLSGEAGTIRSSARGATTRFGAGPERTSWTAEPEPMPWAVAPTTISIPSTIPAIPSSRTSTKAPIRSVPA